MTLASGRNDLKFKFPIKVTLAITLASWKKSYSTLSNTESTENMTLYML